MMQIFEFLQGLAGFGLGFALLIAGGFASWHWSQTQPRAQAAILGLMLVIAVLILRLATGQWPGSGD